MVATAERGSAACVHLGRPMLGIRVGIDAHATQPTPLEVTELHIILDSAELVVPSTNRQRYRKPRGTMMLVGQISMSNS